MDGLLTMTRASQDLICRPRVISMTSGITEGKDSQMVGSVDMEGCMTQRQSDTALCILFATELYPIVSGSGSPQLTWMHLCVPTNSRDIEIYGI